MVEWGTVVKVYRSIIDIKFDNGLPKLNDVILVRPGFTVKPVTCKIIKLFDNNIARALPLQFTNRLKPGNNAFNVGNSIKTSVPNYDSDEWGTVIEVSRTTIDIKFSTNIPKIYDKIIVFSYDKTVPPLTCEILQTLSDTTVRALTSESTNNFKFGNSAFNAGDCSSQLLKNVTTPFFFILADLRNREIRSSYYNIPTEKIISDVEDWDCFS